MERNVKRTDRVQLSIGKSEKEPAWFDDFFTIDPALLDEGTVEEKNMIEVAEGAKARSEKQQIRGPLPENKPVSEEIESDLFYAVESGNSDCVVNLIGRCPSLAKSKNKVSVDS
jgi:hypothetical protein